MLTRRLISPIFQRTALVTACLTFSVRLSCVVLTQSSSTNKDNRDLPHSVGFLPVVVGLWSVDEQYILARGSAFCSAAAAAAAAASDFSVANYVARLGTVSRPHLSAIRPSDQPLGIADTVTAGRRLPLINYGVGDASCP